MSDEGLMVMGDERWVKINDWLVTMMGNVLWVIIDDLWVMSDWWWIMNDEWWVMCDLW